MGFIQRFKTALKTEAKKANIPEVFTRKLDLDKGEARVLKFGVAASFMIPAILLPVTGVAGLAICAAAFAAGWRASEPIFYLLAKAEDKESKRMISEGDRNIITAVVKIGVGAFTTPVGVCAKAFNAAVKGDQPSQQSEVSPKFRHLLGPDKR